MPKRRSSAKVEHTVVNRKIWVVYSTNRQYCFAEEIRAGFFGPLHMCGCTACEPVLVLPEPPFMKRHGEVRAGQPEGQK